MVQTRAHTFQNFMMRPTRMYILNMDEEETAFDSNDEVNIDYDDYDDDEMQVQTAH